MHEVDAVCVCVYTSCKCCSCKSTCVDLFTPCVYPNACIHKHKEGARMHTRQLRQQGMNTCPGARKTCSHQVPWLFPFKIFAQHSFTHRHTYTHIHAYTSTGKTSLLTITTNSRELCRELSLAPSSQPSWQRPFPWCCKLWALPKFFQPLWHGSHNFILLLCYFLVFISIAQKWQYVDIDTCICLHA